ncbi:IS256 family transposase, partial [Facilibium subflavum]|uniref:IS256 family transposase n=1 Tax=Facilibium subflavum TaxID=2219058 RepID=UPI000E64E34C
MKNKEQNKALDQALDLIVESGADLSNLFKSDGVLKQLTKGLVERALQGELKAHLGYDRHERSDSVNARNGTARKSLITEDGPLEIDVPRDRSGEFDPVLVPKRSTRIEGLNEKIISLYAKGMSVSDIQLQLQELYGGAEISTSLISKITDEVLEEVKHWQSRPLDAVYPIVFFDCLVVKVRQDKRVLNKAVYVALGIDRTGRKDVLGLWMSENEGAKVGLANVSELKDR